MNPPSKAAASRRRILLDLGWPTSERVGQQLGFEVEPGEAAVALRAARRLLGVWSNVSCLPDPLDPSSPDLCESAPGQAARLNSASCCIDSSSFAFAAFAHPCHRGNVIWPPST